MDNQKHEESLGQFEQFTEQYMTYTTSSQLVADRNSNSRKITTAAKTEKPKLKIINQATDKGSIDSILNSNKKHRKYTSSNCKIIAIGDAVFRSNFESGNIQSVQKVAPATYEITLMKEVNSDRVSAWFYFMVEGMKGQAKFIIKGFTKTSSLYNQGMKICYKEAQENKWRRGGTKILYTQSYCEDEDTRRTYQLHFCYFFKSTYPNGVQFAYCFPYTYTNLIKFISLSQSKLTIQSLGKTYEGRQIPLLTIGNLQSQYVIVVSARAHPGETVGSLIMEGFLKELIGQSEYSKCLRQAFLFKIVPMINPDGVSNGNYRFSGSGFDLNRKWKTCTMKMHPEVYLFREKIRQISKEKQIIMFIDLHGHSRQKNVFFYGCSSKELDKEGNVNTKPKQFPYLMSRINSAFRYEYCSYAMQKEKEGTARISMWNELKIDYIYTLEASLSGTDISSFLVADYEKLGQKLCQGMCLHFWSLIKQKTPKTQSILNQETQLQNKMNQEIKKNMAQFFENPDIAKVEFEGNSSDSEPEAGQIPQAERKKQKSAISIQKYYKASRIMKFNDKSFFEQDNRSFSKSKQSFQQKIESNLRNKTNESIRLVKAAPQSQNSPPSKSDIKNLSADLQFKTQNQFYVRAELLNRTINERLKIDSQKYTQPVENNIYLAPETFTIKNENEELIRNDLDKNKKKAVSFEGAQYRRVRKLAEQHNRRHFSAQHSAMQTDDETLIRGLVGMNNLLELQKGGARQRAPSFFPNNSHYSNSKPRKANPDLHFRRQIRASDYTSRRFYVNGLEQEVKCFGKQII